MKKRNLKIFDLTKQYKGISKEINSKIIKVLGKGQYILGKNVMDFEKRFSDKFGAKHAITCNSGTDALLFSLKCSNIKKGDEVITTPFTYFATAEVVIQCGAKPVFVDINPLTFNIDYDLIERAITKNCNSNLADALILILSSTSPIKKKPKVRIKKEKINLSLKLLL